MVVEILATLLVPQGATHSREATHSQVVPQGTHSPGVLLEGTHSKVLVKLHR